MLFHDVITLFYLHCVQYSTLSLGFIKFSKVMLSSIPVTVFLVSTRVVKSLVWQCYVSIFNQDSCTVTTVVVMKLRAGNRIVLFADTHVLRNCHKVFPHPSE